MKELKTEEVTLNLFSYKNLAFYFKKYLIRKLVNVPERL